ncbi:MAG: hypothetical protein WD021_01535 [Rhodothermales bacterium]
MMLPMEALRMGGRAWILLVLLMLTSCDVLQSGEAEEDVDPKVEIRRHVDTFLAEAGARGRTGHLFKPGQLVITTEDVVSGRGGELCGIGGANESTGGNTTSTSCSTRTRRIRIGRSRSEAGEI